MSQTRQWTRQEAERSIADVLDDAKSGNLQKIVDSDGLFEVRFIDGRLNRTTGKLLAKGGPIES